MQSDDKAEKAIAIVYDGKVIDILDSLQHNQFCKMMASKTSNVKPQSLPPSR